MAENEELIRLGLLFRRKRLYKGLTQLQLAALCDKDQQSIQRLEKGKVNPSYLYMLEVCEGLDIRYEELFISEEE